MLQNKFTKPIMVNGVKADDVSYYFSKPKTIYQSLLKLRLNKDLQRTKSTSTSDYQEVDGIYFPFQSIKMVKK
jgi:hypothetical protein